MITCASIRLQLILSHILHRQMNPLSLQVNRENLDHYLLMKLHYRRGIPNIGLAQVRYMNKAILLYSYIDKGSEFCNICYNSVNDHSFLRVWLIDILFRVQITARLS